MDQLVDKLKIALSSTFALYLKAHNFHWNVEGHHFAEYHKFLDDYYNEVWEAVDAIAEHIRTLDAYAPGSFSRFQQMSVVEDELSVPKGVVMMARLAQDNARVIAALTDAYQAANAAGKIGLANFLQDRVDIHEKHGWMLRSFTKEH